MAGFLTGVVLGVGDPVHGQDVAIAGVNPVGLSRVAFGSDQLDLLGEGRGGEGRGSHEHAACKYIAQ